MAKNNKTDTEIRQDKTERIMNIIEGNNNLLNKFSYVFRCKDYEERTAGHCSPGCGKRHFECLAAGTRLYQRTETN